METYTVGIIGAGAWGTALGTALARGGHKVQLWAMEEDVVESVNGSHENKRYLPGLSLYPTLTASTDIKEVAKDKQFLIMGSPSLYLASTIARFTDVPNIADGSTIIGALTKGFVPVGEEPHFVLETMESALPASYKDATVYIAGPSHAEEVAMGKITGLIAASNHHRNAIQMRDLLRVPGILAYAHAIRRCLGVFVLGNVSPRSAQHVSRCRRHIGTQRKLGNEVAKKIGTLIHFRRTRRPERARTIKAAYCQHSVQR